tara:strand:- start:889 stop:1059 length:171 start_codon:yes stop_codon:yes gene_type:complete
LLEVVAAVIMVQDLIQVARVVVDLEDQILVVQQELQTLVVVVVEQNVVKEQVVAQV